MIDMLYPLIQGLGGGGVYCISSTSGINGYAANHEDIDEYDTGLLVAVTFSAANTGNVTLNINDLGARDVLGDNNVQLRMGEILAGSTHLLIFDGAQFLNVSQRARLSAAQMETVLAGLIRTLGTTTDIVPTDTVMQALGKAASLASPITGYALPENPMPLAANQTLRAALGNLQGQINDRAGFKIQRGQVNISPDRGEDDTMGTIEYDRIDVNRSIPILLGYRARTGWIGGILETFYYPVHLRKTVNAFGPTSLDWVTVGLVGGIAGGGSNTWFDWWIVEF